MCWLCTLDRIAHDRYASMRNTVAMAVCSARGHWALCFVVNFTNTVRFHLYVILLLFRFQCLYICYVAELNVRSLLRKQVSSVLYVPVSSVPCKYFLRSVGGVS